MDWACQQQRPASRDARDRCDRGPKSLLRAAILAALLAAGTTAPAMAAPPPGVASNGPVARWYNDLKQPATGYSCCSLADCRPVDERIAADGHYEVRLHPTPEYPRVSRQWWPVPDKAVLHGHENPTGEPIACFDARMDESGAVMPFRFYCFVPDAGT